ncbi:autotransporter strand-loop-strand O-heptosyltransferase [Acetobacter thailandicus]|uniref:autotransporter strand-loop-strand O-heptosyltransferase n=1 Tax=Acetobacter thailandicus TaxID=1502842 RepID=UPI001BAA9F3F|nr:autotransporter strand-loop-strand O-heptosyltransferase [Acetobacter thailandicus]MBS1004641.1 autotransporter strand-loop-strand O-heptosyltransferase [Acetobacter thailandicus]
MDTTPASFTQEGPYGIKFDFNVGARILLPEGHKWDVEIIDFETRSVIYQVALDGGVIHSKKKYFLKFYIKIWKDKKLVFEHCLDLRQKPVQIQMENGGLGDHIAWISHVEAFRQKHQCQLFCVVRKDLQELFQATYPDIIFITDRQQDNINYYATYVVLVFYNDSELDHSRVDYREAGLVVSAAYILGLPPVERPTRLALTHKSPPPDQPYICIATQGSSHCKFWNNPYGWKSVIHFLKQQNYRVICIDKDDISHHGRAVHTIPHGAEDMTGPLPLRQRAELLQNAAFFIGLSSGLSWLAWASGIPVVMISGFTAEKNEFYTPWRIINHNVCNSCSNDIRCRLDVTDYFWCPRFKDTPKEFECSKGITPDHVISAIGSLIEQQKTQV